MSGKEYKLVGTLVNKTTGEPFKLNGEEIRSEVVFTPEKAEGEVTVSFPFVPIRGPVTVTLTV